MKIGIEVQHMLRPRKQGMDIVNLEILKELQQTASKHDYYLYAQPDKDTAALNMNKNMHLQLSGPASFHTWEQEILPEVIEDDDISLLHCTNNTAPILIKVPLIVTIHNIFYMEKCMLKQGSWYQRFGHLYRQWNVPRIAKRAELIITVSDYEREQIIEGLKISPEKVKTIYNACGKHFTPERDEESLDVFRDKFDLPEKFVLFFGNTGPKKNLPNVLKSMDILYQRGRLDFTLVMPDMNETKLLLILEAYQLLYLRNHILLTGYVPNDELPNLYRLSQVFLYPSLAESFGTPILEAMACGTPVITSNTTAMPEVAGKNALLVDPRQPEQIAEMIINVTENQEVRADAIAHGIERASHFSWKKTTAEIVKAYDAVIG